MGRGEALRVAEMGSSQHERGVRGVGMGTGGGEFVLPDFDGSGFPAFWFKLDYPVGCDTQTTFLELPCLIKT